MTLPRFGKELDNIWTDANAQLQQDALERAAWVLGNLAHYYHGRPYEQEDRERLAAELIRFTLDVAPLDGKVKS